jgi:hypothetical protein
MTVEVKLKRKHSEGEIAHNRKTHNPFRDVYVYTLLYH